jgi:hypothetical protein
MPKCKSPQRRCCLVAGWEKTERLIYSILYLALSRVNTK